MLGISGSRKALKAGGSGSFVKKVKLDKNFGLRFPKWIYDYRYNPRITSTKLAKLSIFYFIFVSSVSLLQKRYKTKIAIYKKNCVRKKRRVKYGRNGFYEPTAFGVNKPCVLCLCFQSKKKSWIFPILFFLLFFLVFFFCLPKLSENVGTLCVFEKWTWKWPSGKPIRCKLYSVNWQNCETMELNLKISPHTTLPVPGCLPCLVSPPVNLLECIPVFPTSFKRVPCDIYVQNLFEKKKNGKVR